MLIVNLYINRTPIKAVGIHQIQKLTSDLYLYDVYIANEQRQFDIGNALAQVEHNRKEGAEILAAKALMKIANT